MQVIETPKRSMRLNALANELVLVFVHPAKSKSRDARHMALNSHRLRVAVDLPRSAGLT